MLAERPVVPCIIVVNRGLDGSHDARLGVVLPHAELHVLFIVLREGLQSRDVEHITAHPRQLALGVDGIAKLLHMGGIIIQGLPM